MENIKKFQKAIDFTDLAKSLRKSETFEKAVAGGLPVGTIRIWHGQKFIKQPDGHWIPLSAGQAASQGSTQPVAESAQQKESEQATATETQADIESTSNVLDSVEPSKSVDHLKPGKEGGEMSLTLPDLKALLEMGPYSIVSAGANSNDEKDRAMTDAQVQERYKQLEEDLKAKGYKYTVVDGNYDGEEKLYMVPYANTKDLEALGKKYNQDSVVHMENGNNKMSFTSGEHEGEHHKGAGYSEVPDAENYYSVVKTKEGQDVKFTMDFDFGQHHSEDGSSDAKEPKQEPKAEQA